MIIIGIDPGYRTTGYGIIQLTERPVLLASGYISVEKHTTYRRLKHLQAALQALLDIYQPSVAAIEGIFVAKNPASTIKLAQTMGIILLTLDLNDIPCHEYSPRYVKLAITGEGSASKNELSAALSKFFVLQKKQDANDALGLALCHMRACVLAQGFLTGKIVAEQNQLYTFEEAQSKLHYKIRGCQLNTTAALRLYMHSHQGVLYGFETEAQRTRFAKLASVIPANTALHVLASCTIEDLLLEKLLHIPGVGPKTALR